MHVCTSLCVYIYHSMQCHVFCTVLFVFEHKISKLRIQGFIFKAELPAFPQDLDNQSCFSCDSNTAISILSRTCKQNISDQDGLCKGGDVFMAKNGQFRQDMDYQDSPEFIEKPV